MEVAYRARISLLLSSRPLCLCQDVEARGQTEGMETSETLSLDGTTISTLGGSKTIHTGDGYVLRWCWWWW